MGLKRPTKTPKTVKTLLIDGENLLKIGWHVNSTIVTENGRVKTIYHFLNTIKKFYTEYGITKVVVFWDGINAKKVRRDYYPEYKANRGGLSEDDEYDLNRQRIRIRQYLEELYIRQIIIDDYEADDGIALYTQIATHEDKIIFSGDRDLLQLINNHTSQFLPDKRIVISPRNFNDHFDFHYANMGVVKMIAGDTSDNICGIIGVGKKTFLKHFPEVKTQRVSLQWVKNRAHTLAEEQPKNKVVNKIINGSTKYGDWGDKYFSIMNKIINLNESIMTKDAEDTIIDVIFQSIDPTGRGGVNGLTDMLVEDGIQRFIPSSDDGYYAFWSTFITIINKEKKIFEEKST